MKKAVIVSGLPNAGSSTASKIVAKDLGVNYFSAGRLFKDISQGKAKDQYYYPEFSKICESKKIKILAMSSGNDSKAVIDLWDTGFGKNLKLHEAIDELVIKLADKGDIIIDGKLSIHFVKGDVLKVWLKASIEKRAERAAERDKFSLEEAKRIIEERQNKERKEWKKMYGFDYFNQEKEADLVIDTSNISPEEVAHKIIDAINGAYKG